MIQRKIANDKIEITIINGIFSMYLLQKDTIKPRKLTPCIKSLNKLCINRLLLFTKVAKPTWRWIHLLLLVTFKVTLFSEAKKVYRKMLFWAFLIKKATKVIKAPYDGNYLNYFILIDNVLKLVIYSCFDVCQNIFGYF